MTQVPIGVPQLGSARTAQDRRVLLTRSGAIYMPGNKIIDGSKGRDPLNTGDVDVLRAGLMMGKITSGGKYAPAVIGPLTVAYDSSAAGTQVTVSTATATELLRRIGATGTFNLTGPPDANGVV